MARLLKARTLVLGGLAVGAAVGAANRDKLAGLLGIGPSAPEPYPAPATAGVGTAAMAPDVPAPPPVIANADVAGPPENTSTHVPAPDPLVHDEDGGIDEAAEEAAAAAEAANIGGTPADYPSEEDSLTPAEQAQRPLEEAGEGYAEGQELAEADLIENAEPAGGDPVEGERQVEEAIEAQDEALTGEIVEGSPMGETEPVPNEAPVVDPGAATEVHATPAAKQPPPPTGEPVADAPPPPPSEPPADEKSTAVWRTEEAGSEEESPIWSDTADGA